MAYARINHTGVHKGRVQVVNSFYLEPTDPNYDKCQAYVPIFPPEGYPGKVDKEGNPAKQADYDTWVDGLPHVWQNNPFHNHVLYFDKDTDDATIKAKIEEALNYFYTFHQKMWTDGTVFIDEWKKVPKAKDTIRCPFIKGDLSEKNISDCELKAIDIKARELSILPTISSISPVDLNIGDKGTIDVGTIPADRGSTANLWAVASGYRTYIDYNNAANADGVIDTVTSWFIVNYAEAGNLLKVGTFTDNGSASFTCHDAQEIGEVSEGESPPFTGLSIDISTGEFIGADARTAKLLYMERDLTGHAGIYWLAGQYCDPTDETTFTLAADDCISLYGTGTESGGAVFIPRVMFF